MNRPVNISEKIVLQKVLVAPLDWGLGHYTRCIPVIHTLLQQNNQVFVAAGGAGARLLKTEFPQLTILDIPSYNITYPKKGKWFLWRMLFQLPAIYRFVKRENRWLRSIQAKMKFDRVISDNRLGLSHPDVQSVYITHQLQIQTGNKLTDRIAQKLHYHYIEQFHECWVPDYEGKNNLAGDLSHPAVLPNVPVKYIGPLSRFEKITAEKKYDIAFVISGPEPQRSIFEKLIVKKITGTKERVALVRGLPDGDASDLQLPACVDVFQHLPSGPLNELMASSRKIVVRSGYSTIMDLEHMEAEICLVPTPGQTEQEYLAAYHTKKGTYHSMRQEEWE